jgi:prevent-host-death family protein
MVMADKFVTMSSRWNVASAKACLSRVLARAQRSPQVIEKRGAPVAVVVGAQEYARLADGDRQRSRWRRFLELSADLREEGGVELEMPEREARSSPFGRRRTA